METAGASGEQPLELFVPTRWGNSLNGNCTVCTYRARSFKLVPTRWGNSLNGNTNNQDKVFTPNEGPHSLGKLIEWKLGCP